MLSPCMLSSMHSYSCSLDPIDVQIYMADLTAKSVTFPELSPTFPEPFLRLGQIYS
eukprot:COSAG05_NODE_847_length_6998_cov_1.434121_5_plen_56_part_00